MKQKRMLCLSLAFCLCLCIGSTGVSHAATLQTIRNETELRNAFFNGGSYVLSDSITLQEPLLLSDESAERSAIFAAGDVTLDLNGHEISSTKNCVFEIGSYGSQIATADITICDTAGGGKISADGRGGAAILLTKEGNAGYPHTLRLEGGRYEGRAAALSIVSSAEVQIAQGTFLCMDEDGVPIIGTPSFRGDPQLSADGKQLIIGAADHTEPTTQPVSSGADEAESQTVPTGEGTNQQNALIDVSTSVPGASYQVTIPATIPVRDLERAEPEAPDKISETDFTVSIADMEHFFGEKSVQITLRQDGLLKNKADALDTLPYTILQNGAPFEGKTAFALLNEAHTEQSGVIAIDRSLIRKQGNYQGTLEFEITVVER